MKIIFITGGARSGKSAFALREGEKIEGRKLFIATAQPLDAEMTARIDIHRRERSRSWDTVEEPLRIGETLKGQSPPYKVVLVDCLTLWLSNLMGADAAALHLDVKINAAIDLLVDDLLEIRRSRQRCDRLFSLFLVSNEVGLGIVPDNPAARVFRDAAGRLNQKIAALADAVYFMVSGLPLQVKG